MNSNPFSTEHSNHPFNGVPLHLPLVKEGVCQGIDTGLLVLISNLREFGWEHPAIEETRFTRVGSYQFLALLRVRVRIAGTLLSICFGRQQVTGYGFWSADEILLSTKGQCHGLKLTNEMRGYIQPGYHVYHGIELEQALLNFHGPRYRSNYREALNLQHTYYIGSLEQDSLVYPDHDTASSQTIIPFLVQSQRVEASTWQRIAVHNGNVLESAPLINSFAAAIMKVGLEVCPTQDMLSDQLLTRWQAENQE